VCEWLLLVILGCGSSDVAGTLRISKPFRALRILRAVRFIRVGKLLRHGNNRLPCMHLRALHNVGTIVKLLCIVILFNHFVGCGYYWIGAIGSDSGWEPWFSPLDANNAGAVWRWVEAVHWSISQFLPAPNDRFPRNPYERGYAFVVILLACFLFPLLITSLSGTLSQIQKEAVQRLEQEKQVHHFIQQNKLTRNLAQRIVSWLGSSSGAGLARPGFSWRKWAPSRACRTACC